MRSFIVRSMVAAIATLAPVAAAAADDDPLLQTMVEQSGGTFVAATGVPALIMAVVHDGKSVVAGFGERAGPGSPKPDGETIFRTGSLYKTFSGAMLSSLVADGRLGFEDRPETHLKWGIDWPAMNGRDIRVIDLATHASGLARDIEPPAGQTLDPAASITPEVFEANLKPPLLFAPGTGVSYSNVGFDILSHVMVAAAGEPYFDYLTETILKPNGFTSTTLTPSAGQLANRLHGQGPDGKEIPDAGVAPPDASGGYFSTANDMVRWLKWHLRTERDGDAEMRLLDHAQWLSRDGLSPIFLSTAEVGQMDAMGLAWVIMHPAGDRPLVYQKTGGRSGIISHLAFSPARGVGVFAAINRFDAGAAAQLAAMANTIITDLASR
ncbi:serine hydrolase [Microbaculum marinum]|uniref:Serine hydrolase n=1 Tax=Microbaculum marinum TaxID=1764581 RepID=A0AAW9RQE9_9HYPH